MKRNLHAPAKIPAISSRKIRQVPLAVTRERTKRRSRGLGYARPCEGLWPRYFQAQVRKLTTDASYTRVVGTHAAHCAHRRQHNQENSIRHSKRDQLDTYPVRVKPLLLSQRQESLSVLASAVQDFSNPSRQMENLKASTRLRLFFSMNLLQLTFTTTDDPPSIRLRRLGCVRVDSGGTKTPSSSAVWSMIRRETKRPESACALVATSMLVSVVFQHRHSNVSFFKVC